MKLLNIACIFTMFAGMLLSSDPPKNAEADLKVKLAAAEQDAAFSRLEKAVLQEQLITGQLEKIRADKAAAFADLCAKAGIPAKVETCGVDWQNRKVSKIEPTPAPEPAKK